MHMLNYTIVGDAITGGDGDRASVQKRFKRFEKFVRMGKSADIIVSVRRLIPHERGHAFHADATFKSGKGDHFVSAEAKDFETAVDGVNNQLFRLLSGERAKRTTLIHRGARTIKNLLRKKKI